MKTGNREKRKRNLILKFQTTKFLNFLKFIAFTILATFESFVIRP